MFTSTYCYQMSVNKKLYTQIQSASNLLLSIRHISRATNSRSFKYLSPARLMFAMLFFLNFDRQPISRNKLEGDCTYI